VKRLATALSACLFAACGSADELKRPSGVKPPDPNDKRAVALDCILYEKGIEAKLTGENAIQVGEDPDTEPRIEFFVTSGEAEGRQFQGNAQGAEHIGNALLFVREADDELLDEIEGCLQDL
jgi:hypothetical protein